MICQPSPGSFDPETQIPEKPSTILSLLEFPFLECPTTNPGAPKTPIGLPSVLTVSLFCTIGTILCYWHQHLRLTLLRRLPRRTMPRAQAQMMSLLAQLAKPPAVDESTSGAVPQATAHAVILLQAPTIRHRSTPCTTCAAMCP